MNDEEKTREVLIEELSELREVVAAHARYRTLIEQIPAITCIASTDINQLLTYVSPQIESLLGYKPSELAGTNLPWLLLVHPKDRDRVLVGLVNGLAIGKPVASVDFRAVARDGRIVWLRASSAAGRDAQGELNYHGFLFDVTREKQAEEALRRSHEALTGIIGASPAAIIALDAEGHITLWNAAAERIFGWSQAEVLGEEPPYFIPESLPAGGEPGAARGGRTLTNLIFPARRHDGQIITVSLSTAPQRDANGQIIGEISILTDVTQQQLAEEQLKTAYAALEQRAAQLRALASELTLAEERERRRLAMVLHDGLQQMLVGAQAHVAALAAGLAESQQHELAIRIKEILAETIAASRSLTGDLSPRVLYSMGLAAALQWLGRRVQEQHGLIVRVEASQETEVSESVRVLLFQAMRELLLNVVKHAQVGDAAVRMWSVEDTIWLQVADQGVGFDPMQAVSTPTAGIGLFSIRERVELLGGRIEIDAAPGRGTRVTLIVPVRATPPFTASLRK